MKALTPFLIIFLFIPSCAYALTLEDVMVDSVMECLKKFGNSLPTEPAELENFYVCRNYQTGYYLWAIGSENIKSDNRPFGFTDCTSSVDGKDVDTNCTHY